ncbi:hypothetical protein NO2_1428 [Candidatus Termititenax persephonae]|uniref:DUF5678 domain-containing protein n=1 Tax=Candidatus Termititenax persephonae TaxID=2218525 RepID=A0A388TIB9_9BACT|nr:hypothetical protein NO2_1428 [Candidatus Termititenax persephonae]
MDALLEKEFNYYLTHKKDILKQYRNKYIVVTDDKVVGAYDSPGDALYFASKSYPLGTFLVHHAVDEEKVQKFHSRIYAD